MVAEPPDDRDIDSCDSERLHDKILNETRKVAQKAVQRLRNLSSLLPTGVIEQVEQLHENPLDERRKTIRVSDSSIPVKILSGDLVGAALKDHCPTGMAILLPCPAGVGTQLRVRVPLESEELWVLIEVKHCRKEAEGWVVGCELLGDQPPI